MSPASRTSSIEPGAPPVVEPDLVSARAGDEAAFGRLVAPLSIELRAHCYRMLGSFHDAEDAVQDALLRAWRGLAGFEGRSSFRAWLYTVATRVCLDAIASRSRRALPIDLGPASEHTVLDSAPLTDILWVGPYPDAHPDDRAQRRETLELAFVAALQQLPGNQRAALLLFDVLDFSAAEIAEIMNTTPTSVNSALARARRTIAAGRSTWSPERSLRAIDDPEAHVIATRFAHALERGDIETFVSLLTRDVTWSMPPLPHWYRGVDAVADFARSVPMTRCPSWRYRMTHANGQPAIGFYVGRDAVGPHEAWSITVLGLRGDRIARITSFLGPDHFEIFGLPRSAR